MADCQHEETQVLHEELNWQERICTFCGECEWVVAGPLLDHLRTRS